MNKNDNRETTCRICLKENNKEMKWIFDANDSTGKPVQFSEMLKSFTTVEVTLSDGLPQQICLNCARDTVKTYQFKIKCENSDKVLRNRLNKCNPAFLININDIKVQKEEEAVLNIKTEVEDVDFKYNFLETIVQAHKSPKINSLAQIIPPDKDDKSRIEKAVAEVPCQIKKTEQNLEKINKKDKTGEKKGVVKSYPDFFGAYSNQISNLQKPSTSDPKQNSAIVSIGFTTPKITSSCECKICTKELIVEKRVEKPFECFCGQKFALLTRLQRHKRRFHNGEKRYECDVCKKKFAVKLSLRNHKRIHTVKKSHECDVCKRKFLTLQILTDHKQKKHTDSEKRYECDVCGKKYVHLKGVTRHKQNLHSGEVHRCDICQRKFNSSEALVAHKQTHMIFDCKLCEMKFSRPRLLIEHCLIQHNVDRPFECDVCKKKFGFLKVLNNHKRIHTGETPHECDVCDKKFTDSGLLAKHKTTHKKNTTVNKSDQ